MTNNATGLQINPSDILGVVLAGGKSRRMQNFLQAMSTNHLQQSPLLKHKCQLPLGNSTLLDVVIAKALPQVADLLINTNSPEDFAAYSFPLLPDMGDWQGPLAGIASALLSLQDTDSYQYLATFPADTPFIPPTLIAQLTSQLAGKETSVIIASYKGQPSPLTGLWHPSALKPLMAFLEQGKFAVQAFLQSIDATIIEIYSDEDPFLNINTQDDYERAKIRYQLPGNL